MKNKNEIKNILVITLSNIGDVVLTLPVIDTLRASFPAAELSIMVSGQAKELFENNPEIREVIVYNKKASMGEKLKLLLQLRKRRHDLVLDLRNTLFPYLLGAPYRSSAFCHAPPTVFHMRDRHLWKLKSVISHQSSVTSHQSVWVRPEDDRYIRQFLKQRGVEDNDIVVGISPGARSHIKRWRKEGFRYVCQKLICERGFKVVMIGDREELSLAEEVALGLNNEAIIASGRTTLTQLFGLINRCSLLISNDSAPMHIAAYLKVPVVAVFGPTDPDKYKPQGEKGIVVRKELSCSPCERALCQFNHECMQFITPEEVFAAAEKLLSNKVESRK